TASCRIELFQGRGQNQLPREAPSRQLKIEFDRRNHLTLFSFDPCRFCAPAFHGVHSGVGQNRFAFENFLYFDAAVFRQLYLQRYKAVHSSALSKGWIGRDRTIGQTFQELVGLFIDTSPESEFQTIDPSLDDVAIVVLLVALVWMGTVLHHDS